MRYAVSHLFLHNKIFARINKTVLDFKKYETLISLKLQYILYIDNRRDEKYSLGFGKIVKELDQIDDESKNGTLNMANLIKTIFDFLEFIKDPKKLDDYYSDII